MLAIPAPKNTLPATARSEEHTSELQSQSNLVCRLLLEKKKKIHEEATAARFRQDLLFRLTTVAIRLPPLRDRSEDIKLLAIHLGLRHAARSRKALTDLA